MFWNDLIVDKNLSNDELIDTLTLVFSVAPAEILVVNDIAQSEVSEKIRLICERIIVRGDFLMKLSIYLRDSKLEQLEPKSTIRQFCGRLRCKCLISDSSVNPYSMLLVRESGELQSVTLDPEQLDENEEYIIATGKEMTELN